MIDKIYENDNIENQQIFHDIEQAKKYSNYSLELNQTFGDKSYDRFYKGLMEHKKARGINFISIFQKPKNPTGIKGGQTWNVIDDIDIEQVVKENEESLNRITNKLFFSKND